MTKELVVIDELRNLLDLPTAEERKMLEASVIKEGGPHDPIVVWKERNAIVDGHNRYDICKAHSLPFKTVELSFKDIEEAKEWMLTNQLGRRNLSPLRVTYYLGTLYNMQKKPGVGRTEKWDQTTAEKLATKFDVSERTVRRAGNEAKGIDAVGRAMNISSVSEKLAAIKAKNKDQVSFTKEELQEIGKVDEPEVQVAVVKELVNIKKEGSKNGTKAKPSAPKPTKDTYPVAFCKPDFDALGFNVTTEPKPPLAENGIVYMAVPDEELDKAMELIHRWNLQYEGTFIFHIDGYEGLWSDIRHMYLIAASKGTVIGPKKASSSLHMDKGDTIANMIKLIESYHPGQKRIDMRKKATANGWAKPEAA